MSREQGGRVVRRAAENSTPTPSSRLPLDMADLRETIRSFRTKRPDSRETGGPDQNSKTFRETLWNEVRTVQKHIFGANDSRAKLPRFALGGFLLEFRKRKPTCIPECTKLSESLL